MKVKRKEKTAEKKIQLFIITQWADIFHYRRVFH